MVNIEERVELAKNIFKSGYNCSQSVALAYYDVFGLDKETTAKLSAGFGGGFGRLREVCGCVSGMTFLAGMISPADDPSNLKARTDNYALVQKLAKRYEEINGSIICGVLLGLKEEKKESPAPSIRTEDYYKKRPCAELVGIAARIVGEEINKNE